MNITVISDLYIAGRTEDGQDFTAERFFVVAEEKDGRRFSHRVFFNGCNPMRDEESGYIAFVDIREEASAKAEALLAKVQDHIEAGGKLNVDHWEEIDPVYGSDAYVSQGIEMKRVQEERSED